MVLDKIEAADAESADLRVELEEAYAECMGDGLFLVFQKDQQICLTANDLRRLLERA